MLKAERSVAAKVREEREEKQRQQERSESIKDEIGDEFKPKKKQEEQQTETVWQNRFQSWDRDSVELPNSAKRKEEAIQAIQDTQKQKDIKQKLQEGQQDISK